MSTAQLDKADYLQCGELGPWFSLFVITLFLCGCTHALTVCLLLMCLTNCVCWCLCLCLCTELCYSNPGNRDEGLSGFSEWDFQQEC